MPTPVTTARQCLTAEAAVALDEAVKVASKRGHNQTTSLHAVSALLSLPNSSLRHACARARNNAYSPRLQFKALELCLSVSLDRVPSTQLSDDPPVSNSLMAAIKRSQANQRRQPENFHLYHHQNATSSISCIQVELQNLILSILDDPVVSRVFAEAGFRSSEIKLAFVRPLHQVFNYSRLKGPPVFLCNLSDDSGPGKRGFTYQGPGFFNGDENYRRIGEVLARNKGKNPLLIGVCAYDTLVGFSEAIVKRKDQILPVELCGLNVVCVESDIVRFVNGENGNGECLDLRIEELGRSVKQYSGAGLVVNFGDLKVFVNGIDSDAVDHVVEKLTWLLEMYVGRVWFIGSTSSYEIYLKFVNRFKSVEKDWDLQLLPITSLKNSSGSQSYPKSSLMESFVPFGGFFYSPSEFDSPLNNSHRCISRCHLCNEKCEQEIQKVTRARFTDSVSDHYQSSLPSWLQKAEHGTGKALGAMTRDEGEVLSAKVASVQKKWDSTCQRLHHSQQPGSRTLHSQFPTVVGFHIVEDKKIESENCFSNTEVYQNGKTHVNVNSHIGNDLRPVSRNQFGTPFSGVSDANPWSTLSKQLQKASKDEEPDCRGLKSSHSFSSSSTHDGGLASPASVTSLSTDLNLRISSLPSGNWKILQDTSRSFSENIDAGNKSISNHLAESSSSSSLDLGEHADIGNLKMLFRELTERVGRQYEAISAISETINRRRTRRKCQGGSLRGDVWFSFLGPDWQGKRKIAHSLAHVIYGSRDKLISIDLSPSDGNHTQMSFNQVVIGNDITFRGKTSADYIAAELSKKPLSVVFLENVDKADVQTQNCLSHAVRTGKFSDSHGREVGISNAIFVLTSTINEDKVLSARQDFSIYFEERILRAKCRPLQFLIERVLDDQIGDNLTLSIWNKEKPSSMTVNKRKLVGMNQNVKQQKSSDLVKRAHRVSPRILDLNLPAEYIDEQGTYDDNDTVSDNWLQDFFDQVDRTVIFKPFDFDALAFRLSKTITESFYKIVGTESSIDIDPDVMDQLLAAAYLSDNNRAVDDWIAQVLSGGFTEAKKRYNLGAKSVLKLVVCQDTVTLPEDKMAELYLPQKIIMK